MPLPQILLYAAVAFCLAAVVWRAVRYARHPVHLRWELYPVAHEKGRAAHGGSHFEESEHWTRRRQLDHPGEARAMAAEIFLLEGVRRHNRPLWRFSLPFHLGVYLLIVWLLSILVMSAVGVVGSERRLLVAGGDLLGFAALGLTLLGSAGLLYRRLTDPDLRRYNAPADLFNLAIWLVYPGWVLTVHLLEGGFTSLRTFAAAWLRFEPATLTAAVGMELVLGAVLLAYLPLSRMFHFVAKYFLYHGVRWDDAANPRGGPMERRLLQAMDFGVAWNAPHVSGAARWADASESTVDREAP